MSQMIPLANIVIEDRQRTDLGDLRELAESMANPEFGQLQAIVVEELDGGKFRLIAGGRRLGAAALLQWTEIRAEIRGKMSSLASQRIELEENVRRKDLEWQEKVSAVEKIHKLMQQIEQNWTVDKTAEMLGISRRQTFNMMDLSKEMERHPELKESDSAGTATKKLARIKETEKRRLDVQVRELAVGMGLKSALKNDITNLDCVYGMSKLEDGCVDLIFTDPPYGVDYDSISGADMKQFDDSPERAFALLRQAAVQMYRVLKMDRWCFVCWPTNFLEVGVKVLSEAGFVVAKKPIIWYKPNKVLSRGPDINKTFNSKYETILVCKKGDPIFQLIPDGDVVIQDTVNNNRHHPTQKPIELIERFLNWCSVGGETVLDPFTGSGSTGVAALKNDRNFIGFELSEEYYLAAKAWTDSTIAGLPEPVAQPESSGDTGAERPESGGAVAGLGETPASQDDTLLNFFSK